MEVRPAQDTDLPAILEMQDMHWEEKGDRANALPFDREFAVKNILAAYNHKNELFLVAVTGNAVVGWMWLALLQPHYSQQWFATERYLFVKPQYRGGRAAKYLIEAAVAYSKGAGASYLQLAETSGTASLEKAYSKRFLRIGTIYQIPF